MKAQAMVQLGDERLEMQELEIPKIGPEEGLLRVEACGLCGSDVDQFHGGTIARGLGSYPMIPGHEPVGVIESIGAISAKRWGIAVGDRVALEPHLSCGACPIASPAAIICVVFCGPRGFPPMATCRWITDMGFGEGTRPTSICMRERCCTSCRPP